MSDILECDNCGAVLLKADLFCGECGAPRPTLASLSAPDAVEPGPRESAAEAPIGLQPSTLEPARSQSQRLWQIAVIALALLSVLLCVFGLAAFLVFGLTDSEVASPEENWLYSGICCLLPLAGTSAVLILASVGIWFARLRKR